MNEKLLSTNEVCQILRISRTSLWRLMKSDHTFPYKRVPHIGLRFVAADVEAWLKGKTNGCEQ